MMFRVISDFKPSGDQPKAIKKLVEGLKKGYKVQTLLGVTGSGKTFTMAKIVEQINKPTLVISPNKTLAAQLYSEFKSFFPENKVEFFVSYYDYYQPEAYIPTKDLYIEKNADINEIISRMRISAIKSILTRKDVIVVASVSAIYNCGDPNDFSNLNYRVEIGQKLKIGEFLTHLAKIGYERKEEIDSKGTFRLKGDTIEIFPSYQDDGIKIELFGDEVDEIFLFDPLNRSVIERLDKVIIYPTREFITSEEKILRAVKTIKEELEEQLVYFRKKGRFLKLNA